MSDNTTLTKVEETMVAEISPLQATSVALYEKAKGQAVTSQQTMAAAVAIKKQITAHRTMVNQTRLGITRQFDAVKKAIMDKEAEVLDPLDKAQAEIGSKILAYEEELAREREEEQIRVNALVQAVSVGDLYSLTTVTQINSQGAKIKEAYAKMPPEDRNNGEVKLAFTQSINRLTERKDELVAAASEAKISAEQKKAAEAERKEREAEEQRASQAAYEERVAREREEKSKVKAGVRTVTEVEVENADLVPRAFCSPDLVKVRAAVKAHADDELFSIPGIKITVVKKV